MNTDSEGDELSDGVAGTISELEHCVRTGSSFSLKPALTKTMATSAASFSLLLRGLLVGGKAADNGSIMKGSSMAAV